MLSIAEAIYPSVVFRGDVRSGTVALTIDDGPHPSTTPVILDVLKKHESSATFFLLGDQARAYPDLVTRIRSAGHEVANHLSRDEPSIRLGRENFGRDLVQTGSVLGITGQPKWFRPGSGWIAKWMIEEASAQNYTCVLASAYVQDPKIRNAGLVSRLLRWRVGSGDIVVLHEGSGNRTWTPEVLDALLPYWKEQGWTVGTLGDLMDYDKATRPSTGSSEG